eukprot:TRINITY_DN2733_c0_g1_i1.p1 TRINITY_DN2733_c0_g1~~TRINITY_DN2733_c0_g1_i1.p1  ORF type:complete len:324 (-),score=32.39 TRINITY_DN2733_c0_g1_i1:197-1168(-)
MAATLEVYSKGAERVWIGRTYAKDHDIFCGVINRFSRAHVDAGVTHIMILGAFETGKNVDEVVSKLEGRLAEKYQPRDQRRAGASPILTRPQVIYAAVKLHSVSLRVESPAREANDSVQMIVPQGLRRLDCSLSQPRSFFADSMAAMPDIARGADDNSPEQLVYVQEKSKGEGIYVQTNVRMGEHDLFDGPLYVDTGSDLVTVPVPEMQFSAFCNHPDFSDAVDGTFFHVCSKDHTQGEFTRVLSQEEFKIASDALIQFSSRAATQCAPWRDVVPYFNLPLKVTVFHTTFTVNVFASLVLAGSKSSVAFSAAAPTSGDTLVSC